MKKFFTLLALAVFSLSAQPVYSAFFANNSVRANTENSDKKKEISIGTDRKSGKMHLRFTAGTEGEAVITILNESGKIVFKQISQLANSINIIPLKNVTAFAEGPYTVRLISNNKSYTTGFLIWK